MIAIWGANGFIGRNLVTRLVENNKDLKLFSRSFKNFPVSLPEPVKTYEHDFKNEIDIKIRSTGRLLKGKVIFSGKKALVEIIDEETGISPGQACVFYKKDSNGDKLLGGGWIDKTFNKNLST